MKKIFKALTAFICLTGVAISATSCLERVYAESEPTLSVDATELVVGSEDENGSDMLTDTLFVTSNRSWSAAFDSDVDWVSMDEDENLNLAKSSRVYPLVLRFKDNMNEADRTAYLRIRSEFSSREIKITQKAVVYRLDLVEGSDERLVPTHSCYTATVSAEEDTVRLCISSNSNWTAKILSSATAKATLDKTEGSAGIEAISVFFSDNLDREAEKTASVLISSDSGKDLKVNLTQVKSEPFIRVLSTDFDNINVPSVGGRVTLNLKSNCEFTVRLKEGQELSGAVQIKRVDETGSVVLDEYDRYIYDYYKSYTFPAGTENVTVACYGNTDFSNDKTVTFELIPEDKTPVEKTLTLDKLSKVKLLFRKYPHSYDAGGVVTANTRYQPFAEDLWSSSKCPNNNPEIKAYNGYNFVLHTFGTCYPAAASPTSRAYCADKGLTLGTGYNWTFVTFPAVPGKKITTVTLANGSTSTSTLWLKYGVVGPSDAAKIASFEYNAIDKSNPNEGVLTPVGGGDFVFFSPMTLQNLTFNSPEDEKTAFPASCQTFNLSGTEVNTAYTLVCLYGTSFRWIEVEYN